MERKLGKAAIIAPLVAVIFLSVFILTGATTGPEHHEHAIEQLDQKIQTVLNLTASSTLASTVISACPQDFATPVADKLADLSTYFLIALSALYLEKYLVSLVGYAVFGLIIPAAIVFLILRIITNVRSLSVFAAKLAVFGLVLYAIIPTSVATSDAIYQTYEASIDSTIENAQNAADSITTEDDDGNILEKFTSWVSDTAVTIKDRLTAVLSRYIEAIAVMLVTSCLIPVVILFFGLGFTKILFQVDIPVPNVDRLMLESRHRRNEARKMIGKAIAEIEDDKDNEADSADKAELPKIPHEKQ